MNESLTFYRFNNKEFWNLISRWVPIVEVLLYDDMTLPGIESVDILITRAYLENFTHIICCLYILSYTGVIASMLEYAALYTH